MLISGGPTFGVSEFDQEGDQYPKTHPFGTDGVDDSREGVDAQGADLVEPPVGGSSFAWKLAAFPSDRFAAPADNLQIFRQRDELRAGFEHGDGVAPRVGDFVIQVVLDSRDQVAVVVVFACHFEILRGASNCGYVVGRKLHFPPVEIACQKLERLRSPWHARQDYRLFLRAA